MRNVSLSHPHRIRITEELRDGEHDVNSLQEALGIRHSGVSQHLMLLRANRLVSERREGRRVFYQFRQPGIPGWLLEATRFLEKGTAEATNLEKQSARLVRNGRGTDVFARPCRIKRLAETYPKLEAARGPCKS